MNRSLAIILRALLVAFLVGISLFTASPTSASTINVGCDVNELINAINAANANADADTLELSTGCEYTLTNVDNTDITLGPNGLPVITTDITMNGHGATLTRANDAPAFRLFQITGNAALTLNELTLTGGNPGTDSNRQGISGGAILNHGVLNITNATITNSNSGSGAAFADEAGGAGGNGGAIYNTGICNISDSILTTNSTGNGGNAGGGHANFPDAGNAGDGGAIFNSGTCQLTKSTLLANATGSGGSAMVPAGDGGNGAGIFNTGTLTLNGCLFQENATGTGGQGGGTGKSGSGGAIYNASSGTLNMLLCTLQNNRTADGNIGGHGGSGGNGGALANEGTSNVMQSTLQENSSGNGGGGEGCSCDGGNGGDGGAIFNQGTIGLVASTFNHNHTGNGASANSFYANGNGGNGGALWNKGSASVSNSTFTENNTGAGGQTGSGGKGGAGGAIANGSGTLSLFNVTLQGNGIGTGTLNGVGGNLYNATGTATVNNTILTDAFSGQNCSGTLVDDGGNLRFPKSDSSCVGIFANPKLGPLQDNGGATKTMALALDSPAINAAIDATCPATDQRGIARAQGKRCDSGAFELEAPSAPTLLTPADNKKLAKPEVKLKWQEAERVAYYQVIARMDSLKGKKVVNTQVTTTTLKTLSLESGHWYYWRVKACSKVECSKTSFWRFRIQ